MTKDTKDLLRSVTKSGPMKLLMLFMLSLGAFVLVLAIDQLSRGGILQGFDDLTTDLGSSYRQWFRKQSTGSLLVLLPLSFGGGLVASISPCILSLLPVNLSYIGTREFTSRRDAFFKAGSFVLGVVTVLSLFGLFSSFQGLVMVRYQGYFHVAVGALIILMGLSLGGIVRLPLPQTIFGLTPPSPAEKNKEGFSLGRVGRSLLTGPYGVGLTFALVSSPCTSPVTFAVLAAAAATGSQLQSTLVMVSYALGYTAIIFLASLFAGLAKQTRRFLIHSELITRFASIALLLIGGFYLINVGRWIAASL